MTEPDTNEQSFVKPDGRTTCCDAYTTYSEDVECCKKCWRDVKRVATPK